LDELDAKMKRPYTPAELQRQAAVRHEIANIGADEAPVNAESAEATLDEIEAASVMQSRERLWAKLDEETRQMFDDARRIYVHIGHTILKHKGSAELVQLSDQTRRIREDLDVAYNAYLGEVSSDKAFNEAVTIAHGQLLDIERRLTSQAE
jgi:hypothetical protein